MMIIGIGFVFLMLLIQWRSNVAAYPHGTFAFYTPWG